VIAFGSELAVALAFAILSIKAFRTRLFTPCASIARKTATLSINWITPAITLDNKVVK